MAEPTRRGFLSSVAAVAALNSLPLPAGKLEQCDPRDVLLDDHESGDCMGGCGAVLGMTACWWFVVNHKDGTRWFICQSCGDAWAGAPEPRSDFGGLVQGGGK